jgi:succinate dehydrogenase / fumarate reductase cytochrome b subunit
MKHLMAISGLLLAGFVFAHMVGNLQIFIGPDALNSYAVKLKSLGPLLWLMRIGLIVVVLLHIFSALRLVAMNRAARPVSYKMVKRERSTYASRAMPMTGLILLAFIVFHLLHTTFGVAFPAEFNLTDAEGRHDVYGMMVLGFKHVPVAVSYLVAMALLCMHLSHGVTSFFQSLGIDQEKYRTLIKISGPAFGWLIFVGNCSMPLAVMLEIVP